MLNRAAAGTDLNHWFIDCRTTAAISVAVSPPPDKLASLKFAHIAFVQVILSNSTTAGLSYTTLAKRLRNYLDICLLKLNLQTVLGLGHFVLEFIVFYT